MGFPAPTEAKAEDTLLLPPGYDGPLPDSGFHVALVEDDACALCRSRLPRQTTIRSQTSSDQKVAKDLSLHTGRFGTSIATALEGKVRLEVNPPVPATKFVEASGKSFNTIPPSDYSFFEMINANIQQEPADSYNPELADNWQPSAS